jgi:metal-dependent amidase/aminoacylase/carboxypeptidase family protein
MAASTDADRIAGGSPAHRATDAAMHDWGHDGHMAMSVPGATGSASGAGTSNHRKRR